MGATNLQSERRKFPQSGGDNLATSPQGGEFSDVRREVGPTGQNIANRVMSAAFDGFSAISRQIGAAYIRHGSTGPQKEMVKVTQEIIIQFLVKEGTEADKALISQIKGELERGVFGESSTRALKVFQNSVRLNKETGVLELLGKDQRGAGKGLDADGVVGIRTLNALAQYVKESSGSNPALAGFSEGLSKFIFKIGPEGDRSRFDEFVRRTGGKWNAEDGIGDGDDFLLDRNYQVGDGEFSNPRFGRLSAAAMRKIKGIANKLGCDPDWILAVISFETGGSFSPSIRNGAGSGATGLIQFMPETARGLGTSVDALSRMSQERQLDFVEKYFEPYQGQIRSLEDLYMAVLWPAAVGKSNGSALFSGGVTYAQNRGLDYNNDGVVTKAEAAGKVREHLKRIAPQEVAVL
jgi:hypothetical protein